MKTSDLSQLVISTLDDNKALDIQELDVTQLTDVTERLIICSALSSRHIHALKDKVIESVKSQGERPFGIDGQSESGWVLIDLYRIVVHIMLPETRHFYSLEKLWSMTETARQSEGKW